MTVMKMQPKDKLIHDLIVQLIEATQALLNSAEEGKPVEKAAADHAHDGCSALADRWAEMLTAEAASADEPQSDYAGWSKEKIAEARKDLASLYDPRSLSYSDGIYARSLVEKYQMSLVELERIIGTPTATTTVTWKTGRTK